MLGAISSALMIFCTLLPVAVVSYRPPLRHLALILRFPKAAIHQVQQTLRKFTFANSGRSAFELWLARRSGLEPENRSFRMPRYF
jgi:hypothetical protein